MDLGVVLLVFVPVTGTFVSVCFVIEAFLGGGRGAGVEVLPGLVLEFVEALFGGGAGTELGLEFGEAFLKLIIASASVGLFPAFKEAKDMEAKAAEGSKFCFGFAAPGPGSDFIFRDLLPAAAVSKSVDLGTKFL